MMSSAGSGILLKKGNSKHARIKFPITFLLTLHPKTQPHVSNDFQLEGVMNYVKVSQESCENCLRTNTRISPDISFAFV
jgi:hypothetical protein